MKEVVTKIGRSGRIVIPAEYRRALGLESGDTVVMVFEDGEIRLSTPKRVVQRAQALVREYVPAGRKLSEELLRERREEVARG